MTYEKCRDCGEKLKGHEKHSPICRRCWKLKLFEAAHPEEEKIVSHVYLEVEE